MSEIIDQQTINQIIDKLIKSVPHWDPPDREAVVLWLQGCKEVIREGKSQ